MKFDPSAAVVILVLISPLALSTRGQTVESANPSAASDQAIQLDPYKVSDRGDRGYSTANTVGATLVNTPILDTSLSIIAFNQQFMQDMVANDPVQAAQWASGITTASNGMGLGQLSIRGQDVTANIRDGILDPIAIGGTAFYDGALFERVEIIKGPVGTLYGDYSGQGGLMNLVTKAPELADFGSLSFQVGADDEGGTIYRGVLDVNAVDPKNRNLYARIVVVGQQGTNIAKMQDSNFVVAPMVAYKFAGGGQALLRYMYQDPVRAVAFGDWTYDAANNISYFIDQRGSNYEPNGLTRFQYHTIDFEFTQPFKTGPIDWVGRAYFRYNHVVNTRLIYNLAAPGDWFLNAQGQRIGYASTDTFSDPNLATIETGPRNFISNSNYLLAANTNVDFVGNFDLGPTKNTLLVYGAYLNQELNQIELNPQYSDLPGGIVVWSKVGLPLFNYLRQEPTPTSFSTVANTLQLTALVSGGIQDNITCFSDKVHLVVGFRQDKQNQTTHNYITNSWVYGDIRAGTSRKYGVVVGPFDGLRFFYNHSTTFTPNGFATDQYGQLYKLPNLVPIADEAGIKTSLLHDRLVVTASWFYVTIDNETVIQTAFTASGASIGIQVPAGKAVIKGWEYDGTYAVTDNLDFLFGMGNLVSISQLGLYGRNVPFGTNYRAFGKYTFNDGALKGLYTGLGVFHNSPSAANTADTANIPPYTILDGLLGYEIDRHWRAQLNLNNLLDLNYEELAITTTNAIGGPRINGSLELTYSY